MIYLRIATGAVIAAIIIFFIIGWLERKDNYLNYVYDCVQFAVERDSYPGSSRDAWDTYKDACAEEYANK